MRLFFDTEFTGLHKDTTLVSIGIIAENGDCFYAELTDYDESQLDDWLKENVMSKLTLLNLGSDTYLPPFNKSNCLVRGNTETVKNELIKWLELFNENFEIWSDCLAYDWVLFCNIFGGAQNLPQYIYYIPFDICTLFKIKEIDPDINREEFSDNVVLNSYSTECDIEVVKHNSLYDAKVIKVCYDKLISM